MKRKSGRKQKKTRRQSRTAFSMRNSFMMAGTALLTFSLKPSPLPVFANESNTANPPSNAFGLPEALPFPLQDTGRLRFIDTTISDMWRKEIQEVYIIDGFVEDGHLLAESLPDGSEIFWLDTQRSGMEQLAGICKWLRNVQTVHLFSHGGSGYLVLGTDVIQTDTIAHYAAQFQSIANSLAPGADLILYGCNVAEGEDGQALIQSISKLTGADVTASTDTTGAEALGGDWEMEASVGTIESKSVAIPEYVGTLNNYIVTNANDSGAGSLRQAILDSNGHSGADTIAFSSTLSGGTIYVGSTIQITDNLTIIGPGPSRLTLDGSGCSGRMIQVNDGSYSNAPKTISISGMTIENSASSNPMIDAYGENLNVNHMIFQNNSGTCIDTYGYTDTGTYATLSVKNSLFHGNTAGIHGQSMGSIVVGNCSMSNHTRNYYGAGLNTWSDYGNALIYNTTIYNNAQTSDGSCGGGWKIGGSASYTTTVKHCTISYNSDASSTSKGNAVASSTNLKIYSSIFANGKSGIRNLTLRAMKSYTTVQNTLVEGDIWEKDETPTYPLRGYDPVSSTADPNLAAFSSNGGSCKTLPLNTGSPAINTGAANGLTSDARGYLWGANPDMGAYEKDPTQFEYINSFYPPNYHPSVDGDLSGEINLVMDFGSGISLTKGTGNIVIKKYSDNSIIETIAVTSGSVTVSGSQVTIAPSNLTAGIKYFVEMASGTLTDGGGATFIGFSGNAKWSFTVDSLWTPPGPSNTDPTLTGLTTSKTFNENTVNSTPQIIDDNVAYADADGGDLDTGELTITGLRSSETISVSNQAHGAGNIQRSGNNIQVSDGSTWTTFGTVDGTETGAGTNLKITFNSASTPTNVDALIQRLNYQSSSQTGESAHNLTLTVSDGDGGDTGGSTISVTVNAENDAPTDINLSSLTIQENAGNAVVGDLSTTDPDN